MPFRPINAADACLRRAHRLLDLGEFELPDSHVKGDLRRSALVMSVTAIDSYFHRLVSLRLSHVRSRGELPGALARIEVQFSDLASLADAALEARRQQRDIRPWVQVN